MAHALLENKQEIRQTIRDIRWSSTPPHFLNVQPPFSPFPIDLLQKIQSALLIEQKHRLVHFQLLLSQSNIDALW